MDEDHIGEGTVLDGRFTLERELGRTAHFRVYRAQDARYPHHATGVTVFFEQPVLLSYLQWEDPLRLVRLSDFGSHSRMRLGGRRGQTYYAGEGYDHGVWYRAWEVRPHLIKQPYRYRQNNFSAATRKALLHAADGLCEVCGSADKVQVDHLVPVAYGGTPELENGLVLCDVCHRAKTAIQIRDPRVPVPARPSSGPDPSPKWQYHLTGTPPYWLVLPDGEQRTFATPEEVWLWIAQHAVEIDRQQRAEKRRCEQEYLAWSAEERRARTRARLEEDRKRLEKQRKWLERLRKRLEKQGRRLEKQVRQQK